MTVLDPASNETDLNFSGIYETSRDAYQGTGGAKTLMKHTGSCYNGNWTSCLTATVTPPITLKVFYDSIDQLGGYASYAYTYNGYGLVTQEDDHDYTTGNPTMRTVITAYNAPNLCSTYGICDRPSSVQVTDGASPSHQYALTNYFYDTHGNATSVQRWVSGASYLTSSFTYNANGTLATSTDPKATQTTYSYAGTSCNSAFPTSVTVAGLTTQYTYNCIGGVATSVKDPNNQTTSMTYNDASFWRPANASDPLTNVTSYSYASSTQTESTMNFNGGYSTSDELLLLDSLGRTSLKQQRQSPSSSSYDSIYMLYDSSGRLASQTQPYSGSAWTGASGPRTSWTYDALGRPLVVTDPGGGTVSYSYKANDVLVTIGPAPVGENTKRRQYEYDALGRLTSVCEITSAAGSGACGQNTPATGFITRYTYDPLGNLLQVNQSGQTRTMTYDGLGRMLSETNPESGTKSYYFDSVTSAGCNGGGLTSKGDLVVSVDANGASTCYYYDALHRLTDVGSTGSNHCRRYRYDNSSGVSGTRPSGISPTNSLGRLVEAATDTCGGTVISDEWFSYDARGQATDFYQWSTNSGGWYHIFQSYVANGNRAGLQGFLGTGTSIPFTHSFWYDTNEGEGRQQGLWDGNVLAAIWWGTAYNPVGQPNQLAMIGGSAASMEVFTYDTSSGRMNLWQSFNTGVNKAQNGTLTWNANGTLQKLVMTDSFNSGNAQTCSYGYDDLARLASGNCGATTWNQNFSYDAWGNITKTVPTGSTGVPYNPVYDTHNRASTSSYDSAGNTLSDGSNSYTYDSEGRPQSVGSTQVLYDAFNRTVELNNGASHTQIVYDPQGAKLAFMSGQTLQRYILPLAAGAQAVFTSSGLQYYRHADWLGTSRLALDVNGNLYSSYSYAPFGETYAGVGQANRSFTGQTQDVIVGQLGDYDFLFRQYTPSQGRWLVPDPAGLAAVDIANPQTWNRYAYVGNNPLSTVDPLGLCVANGGSPTSTGFDEAGNQTFTYSTNNLKCPSPLSLGEMVMPVLIHFYTLRESDDIHGTGPCKGDPDCLARRKRPAGTDANKSNDILVENDLWHNSPQCQNCGNIWPNASGAANTLGWATVSFVAGFGAGAAAPILKSAAPAVWQLAQEVSWTELA